MNQPVDPIRVSSGRSSFGSTRDLVSLLFRRKVVFLSIFAAIFAAALISSSGQEVVYVAEAKVYVERGVGPQVGGEDRRIRLHWWEEMKTERVTAQSRPVAKLAAEMLATKAAAEVADTEMEDLPRATPSVDDLMAGTGVEVIEETDFIRFTYRALDGQQAVEGVNALADAYVEHGREVSRATAASSAYSDVAETKRGEIKRLEAEIAAIATQHNIADISSEAIEMTRQKRAMENQLSTVAAELREREREVQVIENTRAEHPDVLVPTEDLNRDPNMQPYLRRLAELQGKLNTLLATYTRDNPQVRAVERDIEACEGSIRSEVDKLLIIKKNALKTLRAKEQAYRDELGRVTDELTRLPGIGAEIDELQLRLKNSKAALEDVETKHLGFILEKEVSPRVHKLRVQEHAVAAKRLGGGARKQLFAVFSLVLGLGLGFVAAFVVDTLDHSIRFPNDVEDALGIPMLASIREVSASWSPSSGAGAR